MHQRRTGLSGMGWRSLPEHCLRSGRCHVCKDLLRADDLSGDIRPGLAGTFPVAGPFAPDVKRMTVDFHGILTRRGCG